MKKIAGLATLALLLASKTWAGGGSGPCSLATTWTPSCDWVSTLTNLDTKSDVLSDNSFRYADKVRVQALTVVSGFSEVSVSDDSPESLYAAILIAGKECLKKGNEACYMGSVSYRLVSADTGQPFPLQAKSRSLPLDSTVTRELFFEEVRHDFSGSNIDKAIPVLSSMLQPFEVNMVVQDLVQKSYQKRLETRTHKVTGQIIESEPMATCELIETFSFAHFNMISRSMPPDLASKIQEEIRKDSLWDPRYTPLQMQSCLNDKNLGLN